MTQPAEAIDRLRAAEFKAVGSSQTAKAIGKGRAQVVFVAKDADRRVVESVLAAARDRGLEIVEVGSMRELGRVCGIAVGASAATRGAPPVGLRLSLLAESGLAHLRVRRTLACAAGHRPPVSRMAQIIRVGSAHGGFMRAEAN